MSDMAYKIMKNLIKKGKQSKEELTKKANVYYGAGQLTASQYMEIIELIGVDVAVNETDVSE